MPLNPIARRPLAILALALGLAAPPPAIPFLAPGPARAESLAPAPLTSAAIDAYIDARIAQERIQPAPPATDLAFLRRLSLDVRGTIPTPDEVADFTADPSPDKRAKWIDRFLLDPQRGNAWANYWDKTLVGALEQQQNNPVLQVRIKARWKSWVAQEFNNNAPLDEFARDIIAADGPLDVNPAVLPTARWDNSTPDVAGAMTRVFLGKQIQCAQCHNHPYEEDMTQEKFWRMAAFFSGARTEQVRSATGRDPMRQVLERASGDIEIPDHKPPLKVQAAWIDGTPGPAGRVANKRDAWAAMLTTHDRRQFARNFVNRAWAHYLGRGILDPVDDWLSSTATPSHPELLEALTDAFLASGLDVRHLERLILNSAAYQRSSAAPKTALDHPELFAAATLRQLTPTQLFASMERATAMTSQRTRRQGVRLSDSLQARFLAKFVFLFDNDEMQESSDFSANVAQALFLFNDQTISTALDPQAGTAMREIVDATSDPAAQVDALYLRALSRRPSPQERDEHVAALRSMPQSRARFDYLQDVMWALLNSTEFRTNH